MEKFRTVILSSVLILAMNVTSYAWDKNKLLLPPQKSFEVTNSFKPIKKGSREFHYITHYMNYWGRPWVLALKQNGLWDDFARGMVSFEMFDPEARKTNKQLQEFYNLWKARYKANGWPFYTYAKSGFHSMIHHGKKHIEKHIDKDGYLKESPVKKNAIENIRKDAKDLWLGCWTGENYERPALVLLYNNVLKAQGKKNNAIKFDRQMEKSIKDLYSPDKKWTKKELSKLIEMIEERCLKTYGGYFMAAGGPLMQLQGEKEKCLTLGQKNPKPVSMAHARGASRATGKYWGIMAHHMNLGYTPIAYRRFKLYYPVDTLRRWFLAGYFSGAGYLAIERIPDTLFKDDDNDGYWELSGVGKLFRELTDLRRRHPDRGIPYTPIALLEDYHTCRYFYRTGLPAKTFRYFLDYTEEDHLARGLIMGKLLPMPKHLTTTAGEDKGSVSPLEGADTPYGEIFDIIRPNSPKQLIPLDVLKNYRILFTVDKVDWGKNHVDHIKEYVKQGGTLVINTRQLTKDFDSSFTGVELTGNTFEADQAICKLDNKKFKGNVFVADEVKLKGSDVIFETPDGKPLVVRNSFGDGFVIVTTPEFLLEKNAIKKWTGREYLNLRPTVCFLDHFLKKLTENLLPFKFDYDPRANLRYSLLKKGKGWVIVLMSNSDYKKYTLKSVRSGSYIDAEYRPEVFPVKITTGLKVGDALEWMEDRDLIFKKKGTDTVINVNLPSGGVRIVEVQPEKINLGEETKPRNLAYKKNVTASSEAGGHAAKFAVDGKVAQTNGWWSRHLKNRIYDFPLPQWLEVDLGGIKNVNSISIWPVWSKHPQMKNRVYRYTIEASADKKKWITLVDESKNIDPATPDGLSRWFDPVKIRFVKVNVLSNSVREGAMISEIKVFGDETETVARKRKKANPGKIIYPIDIKSIPKNKITFLADIKPENFKVGWGVFDKWTGRKLDIGNLEMENRPVCKHCVFAHAASEITYKLDGKYKYFIAVAGVYRQSTFTSVQFKVIVDGKEKFKSDIYRYDNYPFPVCVDIEGANELTLIVEDTGDSIRNDCAVWGDARLIKK